MKHLSHAPPVKINDRRRFHGDGSPKEAETAVQEPRITAKPLGAAQQELEAARKRIDELTRAYQAGERDRQDFKTRMTREREQLLDLERGNIAVALLEAVDELGLALAMAEASPLKEGVRLIQDNLVKKAETLGIERVPLEGERFNPHCAEATDVEVTAQEAQDGRVVSESRACYTLKGRVIRPGQVKVARFVKG